MSFRKIAVLKKHDRHDHKPEHRGLPRKKGPKKPPRRPLGRR